MKEELLKSTFIFYIAFPTFLPCINVLNLQSYGEAAQGLMWLRQAIEILIRICPVV